MKEKEECVLEQIAIMTRKTVLFVFSLCILLLLLLVPTASCASVEAYAAALDSHRFAWWSNTAAAVQDDMGPCAMMLAANADDPAGLPARCQHTITPAAPAANIPDVT